MKPTGKQLAAALTLALTLSVNTTLAAVTASVDRTQVALGDTLRLTITADDGEELDDDQLQGLQGDFEILQRATRSNTSIINGSLLRTRQLTVDLAPLREGNLLIPAMQFEQSTTPRITVSVAPPSESPAAGQNVVFEAEVDQQQAYVQGQIILTLRVQQAVNLDGRSLSGLKLDNAFVKPLEQHSFQRVIDGRPWLIDELRYAIFPEQSGTLEIPEQVFSGRVDQGGRRSFFDLRGGGQLVRRTSPAITINVLPKPASYPASDWLPAQQVTVQETWSTPPEQLRVGESATRTIRVVGQGLQGAQLPPIRFTPTEGLKYYPDQPAISEEETTTGLEGIREDSAAVVPTRAGTYVIPEIRIPWWNTTTEELQYAVLPERTITAIGTAPAVTGPITSDPAAIPTPQSNEGLNTAPDLQVTSGSQNTLRLWQAVAAVSLIGWLLTGLYIWRKRSPTPPTGPTKTANVPEKQAFNQFITACQADNAAKARETVIAWSATCLPGVAAVSLEQVAQKIGDTEFQRLLGELNAALYRPGNSNWNGKALADYARQKHREWAKLSTSNAEQHIQLYPLN